MKNFSLNKESIDLICGIKYIIIDALYINDIKQELSNLKSEDIFDEIRSKVFPYTDTPFSEYIPLKDTFTLNQIKKVDYGQIADGDKTVLSTDSGVLIFINEKVFVDFVSKYDYGELVNSFSNPILPQIRKFNHQAILKHSMADIECLVQQSRYNSTKWTIALNEICR